MSKKKPKARSPGKLETAIRQSLSKVSVKKLVAMNIPYLIAFYVVEKCAWLYRHCIGGTVVQKLGVMLMNANMSQPVHKPKHKANDMSL